MYQANFCRRALVAVITAASSIAMSASALAATTFTGTRSGGTFNSVYTITTDDTIGVLQQNNILTWQVSITDGTNNETFSFVGNNFFIQGSSLSSTGTSLLFDYGTQAYTYVLMYNTLFSSYLGFQTIPNNGSFYGTDTIVFVGLGNESTIRQGVQTIATVPRLGSAVPEPSTWAMMVFGFGAIGFGLRRRTARKSTAITA